MSKKGIVKTPVEETMTTSLPVVDGLTCLEVCQSKTGQKTAGITRNGQPAVWTFSGPATPLFNPSAYKGVTGADASSKLSLCLSVGQGVMKEAEALDAWAIKYATDNSEKLFGKVLSGSQVEDRYLPVVKKSDKYPSYVRVKVGRDANDRNAPTYWDANKNKRSPPENWQRCALNCHCRIVGFWMMATSFGLSVQLQDAMVDETEASCPF